MLCSVRRPVLLLPHVMLTVHRCFMPSIAISERLTMAYVKPSVHRCSRSVHHCSRLIVIVSVQASKQQVTRGGVPPVTAGENPRTRENQGFSLEMENQFSSGKTGFP